MRSGSPFGLGFALSSAAFLLGAAPSVPYRDGGELSTAAFFLDVAHPTGFPVDLALIRIAQLLPVGDIAFRANLCAGLLMALGVAAACHLAWSLCADETPLARALVSAVPVASLACAPTVLRAATAVEVYASATALAMGSLAVGFARDDIPAAARHRLAALGLGLSLAMHTTARVGPALVLLAAVASLVRARSLPLAVRAALSWASLGLAGAAALSWVPLAARRHGPVCWGSPDTLRGLLDHLSARSIRASYAHRILVPWRFPEDLSRAADLLLTDLGPALLCVGLVGAVAGARRPAARALVALAVIDLAYSAAINPMGMSDRQTLFNAIAALAVLAAAGVALAMRRGGWTKHAHRATPLAAVVLAGWSVARADLHWAGRADGWSLTEILGGPGALGAVPPRAVVLCGSDDLCGGSLYAQHVEGERPDVTVLPAQHVGLDWTWRRLDPRRTGFAPPAVPPRPEGSEALRRARLHALVVRAGEQLRWEGDSAREAGVGGMRIGSGETPSLARPNAAITAVDLDAWRWVEARLPPSRGAGARWVGAVVVFSAGQRVARHEGILRAVPLWSKVLEVFPEHVSAHTNLAVARARQGDLRGAIALTRAALELDPERPNAWRNLADYLAATGDRPGADEARRESARRGDGSERR